MTESFSKFHWSKAFGRSDVPSEARAVAYVIHDHSGRDGRNSHPGMDKLMVDTGLSESTVGRHLKIITGSGWVHQVSSGSNSGRLALASVYDLTYPPGYSESAANEIRDQKIKELRARRERERARRQDKKMCKDHRSLVTDDPEEHQSQMTGDSPPESGTPVTHDGEHRSPVTETPVTSDCLSDPSSYPLSDPHPLSRDEDECDVSSLYDREVNEDAGDAETYAEQWSAAEWRRREETRRVEAEARAERDREYEAKRAQSQAELEALFLTELKSIDWVSNNWAAFEKFCEDENVKLARRLSLAQRARDKSTSSPFGLFKSMIRNGTPGSPGSGRDTSCASPTSGHAWQE